jgi:hypothetical protein
VSGIALGFGIGFFNGIIWIDEGSILFSGIFAYRSSLVSSIFSISKLPNSDWFPFSFLGRPFESRLTRYILRGIILELLVTVVLRAEAIFSLSLFDWILPWFSLPEGERSRVGLVETELVLLPDGIAAPYLGPLPLFER